MCSCIFYSLCWLTICALLYLRQNLSPSFWYYSCISSYVPLVVVPPVMRFSSVDSSCNNYSIVFHFNDQLNTNLFLLSPTEPPSIIKEPQAEISIYLADSSLLNLTCVARGYPQPQVTWYQEGETQSLNTKMDLFTVVMATTHLDTYSVKVESTLMFKGRSNLPMLFCNSNGTMKVV